MLEACFDGRVIAPAMGRVRAACSGSRRASQQDVSLVLRERDRETLAARAKLHPAVGLARVGLEAQADLIVVLLKTRTGDGFVLRQGFSHPAPARRWNQPKPHATTQAKPNARRAAKGKTQSEEKCTRPLRAQTTLSSVVSSLSAFGRQGIMRESQRRSPSCQASVHLATTFLLHLPRLGQMVFSKPTQLQWGGDWPSEGTIPAHRPATIAFGGAGESRRLQQQRRRRRNS